MFYIYEILNKRSEFISKCRHQSKLLLKNVKDTKDTKSGMTICFTLDVLFTLFFLFRCINNCIPDECLNMKLRVVY